MGKQIIFIAECGAIRPFLRGAKRPAPCYVTSRTKINMKLKSFSAAKFSAWTIFISFAHLFKNIFVAKYLYPITEKN